MGTSSSIARGIGSAKTLLVVDAMFLAAGVFDLGAVILLSVSFGRVTR